LSFWLKLLLPLCIIFEKMTDNSYKPEQYWDSVATELKKRAENKILAGDDDPFYHYKRKKFLEQLQLINFTNKSVLEIGPGPGGNLLKILEQKPSRLVGADISSEMLDICKNNLKGLPVELVKTDGLHLPFPKASFDIVITSTVFQHVVEEQQLDTLINSMCNVCSGEIYIFERIGRTKKINETNVGRTVSEYEKIFEKYGMKKKDVKFISTYWSSVFCGAARRIFNKKNRSEGEMQNKLALTSQRMLLVFSRPLDSLFPMQKGFGMMHFHKR
jgi:ubiquinone/menaquinone biosynthesis C-methylase UbiE